MLYSYRGVALRLAQKEKQMKLFAAMLFLAVAMFAAVPKHGPTFPPDPWEVRVHLVR
jgi:hypothetical protein